MFSRQGNKEYRESKIWVCWEKLLFDGRGWTVTQVAAEQHNTPVCFSVSAGNSRYFKVLKTSSRPWSAGSQDWLVMTCVAVSFPKPEAASETLCLGRSTCALWPCWWPAEGWSHGESWGRPAPAKPSGLPRLHSGPTPGLDKRKKNRLRDMWNMFLNDSIRLLPPSPSSALWM